MPSSPAPPPPPPSLLSLPPELLFHTIIPQLSYPDLLSLKHTSAYFYALIDTSVRLKVAWLLTRKARGLECPVGNKCVLKTDAEFCAGEVRRIMERRRRHEECERGGRKGCEVVEGRGWCEGRATRRRGRGGWWGWWWWWVGELVMRGGEWGRGRGRGRGEREGGKGNGEGEGGICSWGSCWDLRYWWSWCCRV